MIQTDFTYDQAAESRGRTFVIFLLAIMCVVYAVAFVVFSGVFVVCAMRGILP